MSEKRRGPATPRSTPPAQRRRHGGRGALALQPGAATTPRLTPPPAPVRLGRATPPPIVGWPHLMVNGTDAEFRRMVRALAALVHRLEEVYALAARSVGLTGAQLELLRTITEADPDGVGVAQRDLARRLGVSLPYASHASNRLVRGAMVVKRPDPVHRQRKLLAATAAGRAAVAATTPLIAAAHNVAFGPLDARAFERLRKIAASLDNASTVAVEILARRTGEELDTSIRELRRTARRLGGKWD